MASLELIRANGPSGEGQSDAASVCSPHTSPSKGSVLIADDDVAHRNAVAATLQEHGYTVTFARSGKQALTQIADGGIDLLVFAMTMRDPDWVEMLCALRDNQDTTPVVVVAAGMSEIDGLCLKAAAMLGAAATFTQPLPPSTFLDSIDALITQRAR